jgi:hypothetical protein
MSSIDISGINKAALLAGLYNRAQPQGNGYLEHDSDIMTIEEAQKFLELSTDFDYLKGRVMKIDISGDSIYPFLYDRDNGKNACQSVIDDLTRN